MLSRFLRLLRCIYGNKVYIRSAYTGNAPVHCGGVTWSDFRNVFEHLNKSSKGSSNGFT